MRTFALRFLLELLCCALCSGRTVKVPSGPLLRVEGTEVTIPCNVSGYDGPSEQNFDWEVSRGGGPIHIVSTWDPEFTDQRYEDRVRNKDIQLKRESNDAVELQFKNIQAADEGQYKCSTPSTDATVDGNYDDSVMLKVIPDGLKVSGVKSRSASLYNVTEGDSFELVCSASTTSVVHTFLSVTWELRGGATGDAWSEVLSLTQQGRFQPGYKYERRYRSGDVRLETVGSDGYRLSVSRVMPTDQGMYRCVVREWVRGEDGLWQQIQAKTVEIATVDVNQRTLSVSITGNDVSVNKGDPLELICVVTSSGGGEMQTEVTWYISPDPTDDLQTALILASLDRWSVVSDTKRVRLSHVAMDSYCLLVQDAEESDEGHYYCKAAIWTPHSNGSWYKAVERTSKPSNVVLNSSDPEYQVFLNGTKIPNFSEDPTELECKITEVQGTKNTRFTVSWYHRVGMPGDSSVTSELIASMDQDWALQVEKKNQERVQNGEMIFSKTDMTTFTLRIQWTAETDRGLYFCVISAWSKQRNDSWVKSNEVESRPVAVFWAAKDYRLSVEAKNRRSSFAAGSTFEMTCKVLSENIRAPQFSVLVTAEKQFPNSTRTTKIISLTQDSLIRLEEWTDRDRLDSVVLEKVHEGEFLFRMYQTQESDAGLYRCLVTAWSQGGSGGVWREAASNLSNPIKVDFKTSGPVFNVTVHSDSSSVYQGEMVELLCIISIDGPAVEPDDMAFDVSWYASRSTVLDETPVFLASLDRRAIVILARRNGSSDVGVERISWMEFRLKVYGIEEQDFGSHFCRITPWVRNHLDTWQKQLDIMSKPIFVTVKANLWNTFKYPLLIGIGLAAAVSLLSCLIGYCSSRLCRKKNPVQETRRERRRLMPMEMD
ncbi:prostaglandin F2 receptor negative regulator [Microcaecilia unicolor]|uniref:Prostaglandin F2 receptor negative regulator n=1 Tax=Microcaecilia unicolor TaxID=1415580 RepID=A0A6P7YAL6_9AMPH|nr:prostaglandin F2 receptor negative regulator [Microcaecilia unicolor]